MLVSGSDPYKNSISKQKPDILYSVQCTVYCTYTVAFACRDGLVSCENSDYFLAQCTGLIGA